MNNYISLTEVFWVVFWVVFSPFWVVFSVLGVDSWSMMLVQGNVKGVDKHMLQPVEGTFQCTPDEPQEGGYEGACTPSKGRFPDTASV